MSSKRIKVSDDITSRLSRYAKMLLSDEERAEGHAALRHLLSEIDRFIFPTEEAEKIIKALWKTAEELKKSGISGKILLRLEESALSLESYRHRK